MLGIGRTAAALLGLALTAALASCGEKRPTDADLKALMNTSRAWSKSAQSGDVSRILSYWTDDATVMMPGEPVRHGKGQITAYVEQSLKTPGFSISWQPLTGAISKSGDIGYLIEQENISFPDGHGGIVHRKARGVTVWKKQPDGSWKNAVDISQPAEDGSQ
jgi:ketosteroid isomerase-like protein